MHRNATLDILEELSHDAEADVRAAVAWNRNTPDGLVLELSQDQIGTVTSAAGRSLEARRRSGSLTDDAQMVH
jgi:hypothetical protein